MADLTNDVSNNYAADVAKGSRNEARSDVP